MSKIIKKQMPVLMVLLVFTTHTLATVLYTLPINPLSKSYMPVVRAYMEPFFMQNWQLFAPEPATSSLQLWYRCEENDLWSSWKDPLASLIRQHKKTYFTHRGKLLYVYQGIARNLLNHFVGLAESSQKNHADLLLKYENHKSHKLAVRWVNDLCLRDSVKASSAQFQVVKSFTKNFSERHKATSKKTSHVAFAIFQLSTQRSL